MADKPGMKPPSIKLSRTPSSVFKLQQRSHRRSIKDPRVVEVEDSVV
jgi:hypothetical protein